MQMMVQTFVRSTLSLTFVLTAAKVVFNIKGRILKRSEFDATLSSVDAAKYRRMEALDKLLSVLTLIVGSVFALQAIGLDGAISPFRPVPFLELQPPRRQWKQNLSWGIVEEETL